MSAFNHHLLRFQLIIIGHYCYHCEKSSCPPALDNLSLCFHFSKVIEDPVNKQKMFIFNGYSTDNVPRYGKSRRKQYNTSRGLFPPDLHRTERPRKASIRKMARSTWIPPPPFFQSFFAHHSIIPLLFLSLFSESSSNRSIVRDVWSTVSLSLFPLLYLSIYLSLSHVSVRVELAWMCWLHVRASSFLSALDQRGD